MNTIVLATESALQANRDYRDDLLDYTKECDIRIKAVDSLLAEVTKLEGERAKLKAAERAGRGIESEDEEEEYDDEDEEEEEGEGGVMIHVEGAVRAEVPSDWVDLKTEKSPFHEEFERQERYRVLTTPRPWSFRESDQLKRSIQTEIKRDIAVLALEEGRDPIAAVDDMSAAELTAEVLKNIHTIDWERVAQNQSNAGLAHPARTAVECRIQYKSVDHSDIDKGHWTEDEQAKLLEAVEALRTEDGVDWIKVKDRHNKAVGKTRTLQDCFKTYRMGLRARDREPWTRQEDERLKQAVARYGTQNWAEVARYVSEHRSINQVRIRWSHSVDPTVRKGKWTDTEDAALLQAVLRQRTSMSLPEGSSAVKIDWSKIAQELPSRTNVQCRARWNQHVDPSLDRHRPWTEEENEVLLKAKDVDNLSFMKISKLLTNRLAAACAEQYTLLTANRPRQDLPEQASADAPVAADETHDSTEAGNPPPKGGSRKAKKARPKATSAAKAQPKPRPKPRRILMKPPKDEAGPSSNVGAAGTSAVNPVPAVPIDPEGAAPSSHDPPLSVQSTSGSHPDAEAGAPAAVPSSDIPAAPDLQWAPTGPPSQAPQSDEVSSTPLDVLPLAEQPHKRLPPEDAAGQRQPDGAAPPTANPSPSTATNVPPNPAAATASEEVAAPPPSGRRGRKRKAAVAEVATVVQRPKRARKAATEKPRR